MIFANTPLFLQTDQKKIHMQNDFRGVQKIPIYKNWFSQVLWGMYAEI